MKRAAFIRCPLITFCAAVDARIPYKARRTALLTTSTVNP